MITIMQSALIVLVQLVSQACLPASQGQAIWQVM
jgi:hypothetical protein